MSPQSIAITSLKGLSLKRNESWEMLGREGSTFELGQWMRSLNRDSARFKHVQYVRVRYGTASMFAFSCSHKLADHGFLKF